VTRSFRRAVVTALGFVSLPGPVPIIGAAQDSIPNAVLDEVVSRGSGSTFWMSPDGQAVVYLRSPTVRETRQRFGLQPVQSLWVAVAPHWRSYEAVPPARYRSFSRLGLWSPDGRRFAIGEFEGQQVHLVVIDPSSLSVPWRSRCFLPRRFVRRVLDERFTFAWAGNHRLATVQDTTPCRIADKQFTGEARNVPDVLAAWEAATRRDSPTVSIMESGVAVTGAMLPQSEVVSFDTQGKATVIVARGAIDDMEVAPSGDAIAIREAVAWTAAHGQRLVVGSRYRYAVRIVPLDHLDSATTFPIKNSVPSGTIRWSPSGRQLAVVDADWIGDSSGRSCVTTYAWHDRRQMAHLCGSIGDRAWELRGETPDAVDWNTPMRRGVAWTADDQLLVRMAASTGRYDWYLAGARGPIDLTARLSVNPDSVYDVGGQTVVLVDGHLQRLAMSAQEAPEFLDAAPWLAEPLMRVVGTSRANDGSASIVAREDGGDDNAPLVYVDLDRHTAERLVIGSGLSLQSFALEARGAVVTRESAKGRQAGIVSGSSPIVTTFFSSATHLVRPVAWVDEKEIPFHGPDGEPLVAQLLLPPNSVPGHAYPTIVTGYPSLEDTTRAWHELSALPSPRRRPIYPTDPAEVAEYCQYGFAVLTVPVHYRRSDAASGQLLDRFARGFDAAVDEAVHLGLVDSARLGLIGHSFGGYTVMGVVTRTQRYRAAVALAGVSDLFLSGNSEPFVDGYGPPDLDIIVMRQANARIGQAELHAAPWEAPNLYVANSPLFAADRVTTPLMIVQGDMDVVPVEQGQLMFSALLELGRRATFVRYAGEGHNIVSGYNAVDLERRIKGWFMHFLGCAEGSAELCT
jgi:hypothetical protein